MFALIESRAARIHAQHSENNKTQWEQSEALFVNLKEQLDAVQARLDECEKDRHKMWDTIESLSNIPACKEALSSGVEKE